MIDSFSTEVGLNRSGLGWMDLQDCGGAGELGIAVVGKAYNYPEENSQEKTNEKQRLFAHADETL